MNVGQLLQKIKDLIAAYKAGNLLAAVQIAWEIVQAFISSIPQQELGKPRPVHATIDLTTASDLELVDELDKCCTHPDVLGADQNAKAIGPVITILMPIVIALVKKWLGV